MDFNYILREPGVPRPGAGAVKDRLSRQGASGGLWTEKNYPAGCPEGLELLTLKLGENRAEV